MEGDWSVTDSNDPMWAGKCLTPPGEGLPGKWDIGAGPGWRGRSWWEVGAEGFRLREAYVRACVQRAWCAASSPLGAALDHRLPCSRLAEKKASIGYTYEDSTVAEVEKVAEKPEEEESPAEEESNSDEDEVIPDIGGVPSLPSPSPQSLGIVFLCLCVCFIPLPLWGTLCSQALSLPTLFQGTLASCRPRCLTHVLCSQLLSLYPLSQF